MAVVVVVVALALAKVADQVAVEATTQAHQHILDFQEHLVKVIMVAEDIAAAVAEVVQVLLVVMELAPALLTQLKAALVALVETD